jgi:hypothetical protein
MFLSLTQELLLQQMLVFNIFSPITHVDRQVRVMIIRNVTVDYYHHQSRRVRGLVVLHSVRLGQVL